MVVELIAHRAGNAVDLIGPAAAVADTIEVDVHIRRRRLEVRHAKVIWPTRIQWDRWWIDPQPAVPPSLGEILADLPDDTALWLDLKGFTTRVTKAILRELPDGRSVTMSSRSWWVLGPARAHGARTMRSVGSRSQVWAVARIRRWGPGDGVVINERFLSGRRLSRLLGLTPTVHTWGVTDLGRARELVDAGIGGVILDDLALIEQLRQSDA